MEPTGWDIACGAGVLRIEQVQLPNKKAQSAEEAARGWRAIAVGSRFETPLDA
ncbi:hypothetical protein D3C86_1581410 [compost metagenome]